MGLVEHLAEQAASGRNLEIKPGEITTGEELLTAVLLAGSAVKTLHTRVQPVIDTPQQGATLIRAVAALIEALPPAVQELSLLTDEVYPYRGNHCRSPDAEGARAEAVRRSWEAHDHLTEAYAPLAAIADALATIYGD